MKANGSSGGCAVAIALGLYFAAVGTEVCSSRLIPYDLIADMVIDLLLHCFTSGTIGCYWLQAYT